MILVAYLQQRDNMVKRKDSNDFAEQGIIPLLQDEDNEALLKPSFEDDDDDEIQTFKNHRTTTSSNSK